MTKPAITVMQDALELQVDRARTARAVAGCKNSAIEDKEFSRLLDLLAPRIRHLIHAYRLNDMVEDAEQACAIAVLRALESYDPGQARFSTHVTWQLRGELQSLRHRVRLDQRRSARSAGITTVRLETLTDGDRIPVQVVDDNALEQTEAGASKAMALDLLGALLDELHSPEHERIIILAQLFDEDPGPRASAYTSEQRRQITRRTYRNCAKVLAAHSGAQAP